MELKIYSPQDTGFIQKIDWNYDELKKEIAAAIESYANSVYTDDMIKKAKEDRAKLNKVSDALKKERTRIRKKLLEPDEQFGKEVQEITGMIQKAASNIDDQIKGYEERLREEKTAKVREFYEDNMQYKAPGKKYMAVQTPTDTVMKEQTPQETQPSNPAVTQGKTYTVKSGDSLWKIAKQFYGNGAAYTKIANANSDKIKNPNLIYPGQIFNIPE